MARGWESKSVEAQIDEMAGQNPRITVIDRTPDPETLDAIRKKENLVLSRTRVIHELHCAQNPRYKAVLTKALADLDAKLSTCVAD
jgi:hypothetical protein